MEKFLHLFGAFPMEAMGLVLAGLCAYPLVELIYLSVTPRPKQKMLLDRTQPERRVS